MKKGQTQLRMLLSVISMLFVLSGCGLEGDPSLRQLVGGGSVNTPPTADAGKDQGVIEGTAVTLDGSSSSDPDGTIVAYAWAEGSITLGTAASLSHTFPAGTHTIILTVTDDDRATATDTVVVTVAATPNQAPTANAGADQNVTEGTVVRLDGSGSLDPDGSIVSYEWKKGSTVLATVASFNYTPTTVGTDTLVLTVMDDDGATDSDEMNITVTAAAPNRAPTAVITKPSTSVTYYCYEGSNPTIVLEGNESSDPDGDILTYNWSATAGANAVSVNTLIGDRFSENTVITRDDLCNFVDDSENGVDCSSRGYGSRLTKRSDTDTTDNDAIYYPSTDGSCTVMIDLNVSDGKASGTDSTSVTISIMFPT